MANGVPTFLSGADQGLVDGSNFESYRKQISFWEQSNQFFAGAAVLAGCTREKPVQNRPAVFSEFDAWILGREKTSRGHCVDAQAGSWTRWEIDEPLLVESTGIGADGF